MRNAVNKLSEIANRVKTPLALAGLIIVVLYAIFQQILALDIFSRLESGPTLNLLQSILNKIFWLALTSLILGVASYLIPLVLRLVGEKYSSVTLLDASLDPVDSPYDGAEKRKGGIAVIQIEPLQEDRGYYSYHFPTIDFKFQNTGSATAFLWRFALEIISVQVDISPFLTFESSVRNGVLQIASRNRGWGSARDLMLRIEEPTLTHIFGEAVQVAIPQISSGEACDILTLSIDAAKPGMLKTLPEGSLRSMDLPFRRRPWYEYEGMNQDQGIALKEMRAQWTCMDDHGRPLREGKYIYPPYESRIILNQKGFDTVHLPSPSACAAPSDITYITMIDPDLGPHEKAYAISRKIPSGDVERFHILVGSAKSCIIDLAFRFQIDAGKSIRSEPFRITIRNIRDSGWERTYKDGEALDRDLRQPEKISGRYWRNDYQIERIRRAAVAYPFLDEDDRRRY